MPMCQHCFSSATKVPRITDAPFPLLAISAVVQNAKVAACCFSRMGRKAQASPLLTPSHSAESALTFLWKMQTTQGY